MLQLSEDEDMNTRITLRVSRPSLLHIFLRILLVTGSIYMFLQLVLDARGSMHQWASNRIHQLDKSLAKRKLLNLNMSETFPTETRTTKQSLTELLEKLFKKPVGSTCADIFDRNLDVPWTTEQASRFAAFQQHLEEKALDPLRKVNFTLEGNYPDQWRLYYEMARLDFVKVVCETGFNAGHSTFMWLNANPDVHVYSFDIAVHEYTHRMAQALQDMFPGRLTITYGDSRRTVPQFHQDNPRVSCDMAVVDGGHHEDIPRSDLENFNQMTRSLDNILILDDWPGLADVNLTIGSAWRENVAARKMKELFYCMKNNSTWKNGITVGQYV